MTLATDLQQTLTAFARRKFATIPVRLAIHAPDCWNMEITLTLPEQETFRIRNLRDGDAAALHTFAGQLGAVARDLFCPYPWDDEQQLNAAFQAAITQAVRRIDASYLLEHNGTAIGHFFLWKAGGNPRAQAHGVEVCELGIAIADAFQGRGFGGLAMNILQAAAKSVNADAIELTTALFNENGWNTYLRAGFEYVGILRIPLGVDITAAEAGQASAERFRDERQMVYIINHEKRDTILAYLALMREAGEAMASPSSLSR